MSDKRTIKFMSFLYTILIKPLLKLISFGYSSCYRCGRPWWMAKEHITKYSKVEGCFPLCEMCFIKLRTFNRRMPYYKKLVHDWAFDGCIDNDDLVRKIHKLEKAVEEESKEYPLNKKVNAINVITKGD